MAEIPQECNFFTWSIQNFGRKAKQFVRRVKGQKMAQNDKKLCCALYLKNHTSYDLHLNGTHV